MRRIIFTALICVFLVTACSRAGKGAQPTATPVATIATPVPTLAAPLPTSTPVPPPEAASGGIESLASGGARLFTADGLSLTLDVTGRMTAVSLNGDPLPITSNYPLQVRDLTNATAPDAPNLLANAGFEEGLSGWATLRARNIELEAAAGVAHEGNTALAFRGDEHSQGAVISDPIPVTAGARYRVSGYFQASFGYVGTGGSPAFWQDTLYTSATSTTGLYLQWLDGSGAPLAEFPQLAAALHKNAQAWRRLTREVVAPAGAAAVQIVAAAEPLAGTVWIDDLAWIESPESDEAAAGALEIGSDHVTQTAAINGLQIAVTYRPYEDYIAITTSLSSANGAPRAFDAAWGLPLASDSLAGWRWWDGLRESRPVTPGQEFSRAVSADITGYLPVSLYPYAVLEDGAHGLSLALPLDSPRYVLLQYDGRHDRFEGRAHLGIDPAAIKLNNTADFTLLLYQTDPNWGLRAAADKHHAIGPHWYDTPAPFPDFTGFEQGFFNATSEQLAAYNAENIYAAQYTVFEINVPVGADNESRPSLEQAYAARDELAAGRDLPAYRIAGVCDSAGEMHLKGIDVYPWTPGEWTAIFAANMDPDLPDGYGEVLLNHLANKVFRETAAAGLTVNGVEIDNFIATTMVDQCPDHIAAADLPLTYNPNTYQPGVHVASAAHEYLVALRSLLDDQPEPYRGISINFRALHIPTLLSQHLDGLAGEGQSVTKTEYWEPGMLDYHMATAMGRVQFFANHEAGLSLDQVETYAHQALFYGVRAAPGERGTGWAAGWEDVLAWEGEQLMPLLALGWQPVPHAWTDSADVWVERYGDEAFVVHNWGSTPTAFTLTVDLATLNRDAAGQAVVESVSGEAAPAVITAGGRLQISGELEPGRTAVYWLQNGD